MKKILFFLVCAGCLIPQVFAGGAMMGIGGSQGGRRQQSGSRQRIRPQSSGANAFLMPAGSSEPMTAEAPDMDEVPVRDYTGDVRQNPNTKESAANSVYAQKAQAIKSELERLPPPVYAISGVKGQELNPSEIVDIVITLPKNEKFTTHIREGEDLTDWFDNLPPGLDALAHGVKKGAAQIRIFITGIPEAARRSEIQITVPGRYLSSNRDMHFGSPSEEASIEAWKAQEDAPSGAAN